ncbi:MAG: thioredoxin TrxC [Deltaproteobacteria bacterium]|nr:thioredoxin TrxC [Deltaproteobacteria bacterium]
MSENLQLVCPNCQTINRVPASRLADGPRCGKCQHELLDGRVRELTSVSFNKVVNNTDLPVVINFWASWCGHCRNFEPVFDEAAQKLKLQVRLFRIESEEEPELIRRFAVMGMPTHIILQNGREIARQSGAMQLSLLMQWLDSYLKLNSI